MKPSDSITTITTGLPSEWARSYIHGLIPEGWRIVHGPAAQDDLRGGVVLTVGADGPGGRHAGGKVVVTAERLDGADRLRLIESLVAELGESLRRALNVP